MQTHDITTLIPPYPNFANAAKRLPTGYPAMGHRDLTRPTPAARTATASHDHQDHGHRPEARQSCRRITRHAPHPGGRTGASCNHHRPQIGTTWGAAGPHQMKPPRQGPRFTVPRKPFIISGAPQKKTESNPASQPTRTGGPLEGPAHHQGGAATTTPQRTLNAFNLSTKTISYQGMERGGHDHAGGDQHRHRPAGPPHRAAGPPGTAQRTGPRHRARAKKRTTRTSTTTRATSSPAAGSRPRSCRRITRPAPGEHRQRLRRSGTKRSGHRAEIGTTWRTAGPAPGGTTPASSRPGTGWSNPGRPAL